MGSCAREGSQRNDPRNHVRRGAGVRLTVARAAAQWLVEGAGMGSPMLEASVADKERAERVVTLLLTEVEQVVGKCR